MDKLFVYGSLKSGGSAHHLLRDAKIVDDKAELRGYDLEVLPEGWVGVVPGNGNVVGEIYEIDDAVFPILDDYEGSEYRRIRVGRNRTWVYVLCRF